MHVVPVGWALRAVFLHECRQGGCTNDGIEHLVHDAMRMFQGGFGQFEQEGRFSMDTLEVTEQLFDDFFFGSYANAMDNPNQELHQLINHFLLALPAEGRQQRVPNGRRVLTHLARRFGRGSQSVSLKNLGRNIRKQADREVQLP